MAGTLNDVKYAALGDLGFTGTLNDRELAWLLSEGAPPGSTIGDGYLFVLGGLGYTGSLNDRLFAYLGDSGYTGTLNDMLFQWWTDGGGFGPPVENLCLNSSIGDCVGSVAGNDFVTPSLWGRGFWPPDDAIALPRFLDGFTSVRFVADAARGYLTVDVVDASALIGQEVNLSAYVDEVIASDPQRMVMLANDVTEVRRFPVLSPGQSGRFDSVYLITGPTVQIRMGTGTTANTTQDFTISRPQITVGASMRPYKATGPAPAPPVLKLDDHSIAANTASDSRVVLQTNGQAVTLGARVPTPPFAADEWVSLTDSRIGAFYEALASVISGPNPGAGDLLDTWLPITQDRQWVLGTEDATTVLDVSVRRAAEPTDTVTGQITLVGPSSAPPPVLKLDAHTVTAGAASNAAIQFQNGGTVFSPTTGNTITPPIAAGEWVVPDFAIGNDYELQATLVSGPTIDIGGPLDTWLPLTSNRLFGQSTDNATTVLDVEIRRIAEPTDNVTGQITLVGPVPAPSGGWTIGTDTSANVPAGFASTLNVGAAYGDLQPRELDGAPGFPVTDLFEVDGGVVSLRFEGGAQPNGWATLTLEVPAVPISLPMTWDGSIYTGQEVGPQLYFYLLANDGATVPSPTLTPPVPPAGWTIGEDAGDNAIGFATFIGIQIPYGDLQPRELAGAEGLTVTDIVVTTNGTVYLQFDGAAQPGGASTLTLNVPSTGSAVAMTYTGSFYQGTDQFLRAILELSIGNTLANPTVTLP